MRLFGILIMSCAGLYAGAAAGGPAVYTVGNLHGISPGTEGSVSLEGRKLVFRAGKSVTAVSYADIMDTELGAKTAPATDAPLYKVWKLPKRINPDRVLHQMLTIEFADKEIGRAHV